eukprot:s1356_g11.t1
MGVGQAARKKPNLLPIGMSCLNLKKRFVSCIVCAAKASAASVVRMSKAAATQYGGSAGCPVTKKLSNTAEKKGEDVCHRVFLDCVFLFLFPSFPRVVACIVVSACCVIVRFQANDLSLNVPISWVPLATAGEDDQLFPILKPSDMVNYLCQTGNLEKLFGEEPLETIQTTLLEFWNRFAKEVPDHQLFHANQAEQVSLSRSVPIMVHGDEGRNFKRKGIMLISFEGVVGKGARPFAVKNPALQKSTVFDALVGHIQNALDTPSLQAAALQLLRRVLLRNQVLTAAVYQCIDTIGEIMITGSDKRTSQQCAQIFVDFMLDYPHEQKALQHRMNHLLKNLGYAEEGGRRAALNCLYLVVLHFPEAQLSSWSSLIFAAAAARLSAETDATAHQMLHVLILSLLRKINASSRERLLDLVLKWRLSAPTVLAECLGLFVEAVPRETSESLVSSVLQALAQLQSSESAPKPWQVSYAIFKSFERILSSVSPALLTSMMDASDSDPGASLKYLWCQLLGPNAFAESRHAWQLAVQLRCLELQSAKWQSQRAAAGWLQCEVTSYGLLGALQQLVTSKRIEVDTSLAPLAVKALRNLLVLVLHHPELVVSPTDEQEEEDAKEELEEDVENPDPEDKVEPSAESAPVDPEPKVEEQNQEHDVQPNVVQTDEREKEEEPDEEEPTQKGKLEEDELEKDVAATAALEEPEGGRQGSVYDALAKTAEELSATALEVPVAEVEERLRAFALMLECVTEASRDDEVRAVLREYCRLTGFQQSEVELELANLMPTKRNRWWCTLTQATLPPLKLQPLPSLSRPPVLGDVLPMFPDWPADQMYQLELDQYESGKFAAFGGIESNLISRDSVVKTALHGWANQLTPCPCQCRKYPMNESRLQAKGLFGALIRLTGEYKTSRGNLPKTRHMHPWEMCVIHGGIPEFDWQPLRYSIAALGQMASPVQSCWVVGQMLYGMDLAMDSPPTFPEEHLGNHFNRVFHAVSVAQPSICETPHFQGYMGEIRGVLQARLLTAKGPIALPSSVDQGNADWPARTKDHDEQSIQSSAPPMSFQAMPLRATGSVGPAPPVVPLDHTKGIALADTLGALTPQPVGAPATADPIGDLTKDLRTSHRMGRKDPQSLGTDKRADQTQGLEEIHKQPGTRTQGPEKITQQPGPRTREPEKNDNNQPGSGTQGPMVKRPRRAEEPQELHQPMFFQAMPLRAPVSGGPAPLPATPNADGLTMPSARDASDKGTRDDMSLDFMHTVKPVQAPANDIGTFGKAHATISMPCDDKVPHWNLADDSIKPDKSTGGIAAFASSFSPKTVEQATSQKPVEAIENSAEAMLVHAPSPARTEVVPPLGAHDTFTQDMLTCVEEMEVNQLDTEVTHDMNRHEISQVSRDTHVIQLIRQDDQLPMYVSIHKDATVGSITVAEAKMGSLTPPICINTCVGTRIPSAAKTQPYDQVFLKEMAKYGSGRPSEAINMPHELLSDDPMTRLALLFRQEAFVANDEMDFYMSMMTATGQAIPTPMAIVPDTYEDEELVLLMQNWLAKAMLVADAPCTMISALFAHFHWFPIGMKFASGIIDLYTTPGGHDWLQIVVQRMPNTCRLHTIDIATSFANDCGFQCIGWIMNFVFDAHYGEGRILEVSPTTAAAWRGLFEHHLHATSKATQVSIPSQLHFGGVTSGDVARDLCALLQEHGVPEDCAQERANVILDKLGRTTVTRALRGAQPWRDLKQVANQCSPKVQLVLASELQAVIAKRTGSQQTFGSKSTKKKPAGMKPPIKLAADDIGIPDGIFQDASGRGIQQKPITAIGPDASGIVVVQAHQAIPYLKFAQPISKQGLALLVLDIHDPLIHGMGEEIRFPARFEKTSEPILLSAKLVQLGTSLVSRVQPDQFLKADEVQTTVIRYAMYRDEVTKKWEALIDKPVKHLVSMIPALGSKSDGSSPILDVWDRQWLNQKLERVRPGDAHMFTACFRLEGCDLAAALKDSGNEGCYAEPRSHDGRSPSPEFRVIWLNKHDKQAVLIASQSTVAWTCIVRSGARFGLRVYIKDAQTVHEQHKPMTPFLQSDQVLTFHVGPMPHGSNRAALTKLFNSWSWQARPCQPKSRTPDGKGVVWECQAICKPQYEVYQLEHADVLISEVPKKSAKVQHLQTPIQASAKTMAMLKSAEKQQDAGDDPWQSDLSQDPWGNYHTPVKSARRIAHAEGGPPESIDVIAAKVQQRLQPSWQKQFPRSDPDHDMHDEGRIQEVEDRLSKLEQTVQANHTQQHQHTQELAAQITKVQQNVDQQGRAFHAHLDEKLDNQLHQIEQLLAKRCRME